jgi:hypothetical protein
MSDVDRDQLPAPDLNTTPDADESEGYEIVVPEDQREEGDEDGSA